jgi:hypothetical protein
MSSIIYECSVTEYNVIPTLENSKNCFFVSENALVISMLGEDDQTCINQTEISREDAIELAKLILFKYNV